MMPLIVRDARRGFTGAAWLPIAFFLGNGAAAINNQPEIARLLMEHGAKGDDGTKSTAVDNTGKDGASGTESPKPKTKRAAVKRFKLTASGKVKRGHSHARHILTKKTAKRKRVLDIDVLVAEADEKRIEKMLPYGRS